MYTRFWIVAVYDAVNCITLPQPGTELLSYVRNTKWPLSTILNYYLTMLDHRLNAFGDTDRKRVLKFRVDRMYTV